MAWCLLMYAYPCSYAYLPFIICIFISLIPAYAYLNMYPHNPVMRYDVAKCWISEQEGVRAHARIVFVDKLFIPNVRAFKEFVGRVNTLLHFAVTV